MTMVCIYFRYNVMGVYPPKFLFNITVILEREVYRRKGGDSVWEEATRLELGPTKKVARSENYHVSKKMATFV